ncbi:MAG: CaiB/BaiF CoA transferase family protein, partial [Alphaproteobacteria bacterium]
GMGDGYLTQGGGKQSVAIDLKTEAGKALVLEMATKADVFLENFRPGTAERLGLGVDTVMGLNPGIVYASLSAYGQDGPMGRRPAYDHVIQAVSGIMQLTGDPETLPNKVGAPYVDYATGQNGALAVLSALMERDRTGKGQRVDVAMLDSSLLLMASHMTRYLTTGNEPKASGNNAFSGSPTSGVFETADGLLALAANNDRQFPRLLSAIGRDELANDPRFADPAERKVHTDALRAE